MASESREAEQNVWSLDKSVYCAKPLQKKPLVETIKHKKRTLRGDTGFDQWVLSCRNYGYIAFSTSHPKRKTQTDKQTNRQERAKRDNGKQKETRGEIEKRESVIGRANTVWVRRDSRDAKTGRLTKKGRAEGIYGWKVKANSKGMGWWMNRKHMKR